MGTLGMGMRGTHLSLKNATKGTFPAVGSCRIRTADPSSAWAGVSRKLTYMIVNGSTTNDIAKGSNAPVHFAIARMAI